MNALSRTVKLVVAGVLAGVIVAAGLFAFGVVGGDDRMEQTAYFTSGKGLYEGDDVRILGVRVGQVESIQPQQNRVKVVISYDAKYQVPQDVKAAIISPSLVASRFVQLAPAWRSGPTLANHSTLGTDRTAVPIEFDQVKEQLTKLAKALGPKGANSKGALSRLITTAEANLRGGNAERLRATLTNMSKAIDALNNSKGDLFGTIKNLNSFLGNLVVNDKALRTFTGQLDDASQVLADNRQRLALTLDSVQQTLKSVSAFVRKNRTTLKQSTVSLAQLTQTLAYKTNAITKVLHIGSTAINNFVNIYDPRYGALFGRVAATNFNANAAALLCGTFYGLVDTSTPEGSSKFLTACKNALNPFAKLLGLENGIPGTPGGPSIPGTGGSSGGTAKTPAASKPARTSPALVKKAGKLRPLLGLLLPGVGS